jgi:hypothetical protein
MIDSQLLTKVLPSAIGAAGLGGWFGAVYGANLAVALPERPKNPFDASVFVMRKTVRCGAVGAAILGATNGLYASYEYMTDKRRSEFI